jgi:NAD(P)-dependent dehydrogenase (short-subunit alcohol dehydrogenase family)
MEQVVAITGATGRLGAVVSARFADAGYRLALLGRSPDRAAALAASLPGGAERHLGVAADLTGAEALEAAKTVREKLGAPTILLHLVGGYAGGAPFAETEHGELREQVDLNLWTTANAIRAFLPDIAASPNGRIVTMSTFVAATPTAKHAAYAASKAAAEALTISVAKDLAGTTATANIIVVRAIGTEKAADTRPEEIAAAMLWLASPDAGAINGQRILLYGRA